MAKYRAALLVGAATFGFVSAALAADLPPPPPVEPAPIFVSNGWYLRGDVGFGLSSTPAGLADSPNPLTTGIESGFLSTSATDAFDNSTLGGSEFFELGVGYQFNPWLRGDITGQLRGGSDFQTLETLRDPTFPAGGTAEFNDFYRGDVSTYILMANVYADIGTWNGITPYVGAGIGYGTTRIGGFTDVGSALNGPIGGFFEDGSQSGFAWSLMTGLDFHVTPNLTMELGYRYQSYEGFKTGPCECDGTAVKDVISSARLYSNDFNLGFRWMIGDFAPQAPLVRRY